MKIIDIIDALVEISNEKIPPQNKPKLTIVEKLLRDRK
jgi:hypothetical protein